MITPPEGPMPESNCVVVRSERELRLADLVTLLWSKRLVILASAGGLFVLAAIISLTITPTYRATTVVAEADSNDSGSLATLASQLGGIAGASGALLDLSPGLEQSLAVLQSVEFTQRFIARQNVWQELFQEDWDPGRNALALGGGGFNPIVKLAQLRDQLPGGRTHSTTSGTTADPYVIWESYRRFEQRRFVDKDRKTQIVSISVDASNPMTAATLANSLVSELNTEMRRRAIAEAEARISFLDKRLGSTATVEMREALFRLIETEQRRALVANTRAEYALRVLGQAVAPDMRISPRRSLIALSGGMLGALFAVMWISIVGLARVNRDGVSKHEEWS